MKYILSIDQGTTSTRAVLFSPEGKQIAAVSREIPQIYPSPDMVEHDPEELFFSVLQTVKGALSKAEARAEDVAALAIANQRETTIVWEKKTGKPVYNAIVWQCRRTEERCARLKKEGLSDVIRKKTGLIPDAYFSATKLEWILDNVQGARERAERGELLFGTVDTFLLWRLSGGKIFATDYTNAARTMLFNIHELKWDSELLSIFNVPECMLPEVKPSGALFGYSDRSFLGAEIPVCSVIGDQQAALYGHGCTGAGQAKITYGTGCFLLMNSGKRAGGEDSGLITTLCASGDGNPSYALEGSVFIGGAAVQWLRDGLGIISSAEESCELAERVKDSNGLCFVPAFNGLGAPYWDGEACGLLCGITRGTRREHIVRAVLEGIAYRVNDVLKAMEKACGISLSGLSADGGASANNFLMQFQSNISQCSLKRSHFTETTSLGAAYMAGISCGIWSESHILKIIKECDCFNPAINSDRADKLKEDWERAVRRARVR